MGKLDKHVLGVGADQNTGVRGKSKDPSCPKRVVVIKGSVEVLDIKEAHRGAGINIG